MLKTSWTPRPKGNFENDLSRPPPKPINISREIFAQTRRMSVEACLEGRGVSLGFFRGSVLLEPRGSKKVGGCCPVCNMWKRIRVENCSLPAGSSWHRWLVGTHVRIYGCRSTCCLLSQSLALIHKVESSGTRPRKRRGETRERIERSIERHLDGMARGSVGTYARKHRCEGE